MPSFTLESRGGSDDRLVPPAAATTAAPPEKIDLLVAQPRQCTANGDDIVVCGRRAEQRLKPPDEPATARPTDGPLSFRLPGGGTGKLHAMQTMLPGAVGQGAAVTLKIPFGKSRKE